MHAYCNVLQPTETNFSVFQYYLNYWTLVDIMSKVIIFYNILGIFIKLTLWLLFKILKAKAIQSIIANIAMFIG